MKWILVWMTLPLLALGIETDDFSVIMDHISEETLVVVDIDNVLFATAHQLGSEAWGDYMMRQYALKGMSPVEAKLTLAPLWNAILLRSKMEPVDPLVQSLLRQLQRRGVVVMGLSDKEPDIAFARAEQLRICDVDMEISAPTQGVVPIALDAPARVVNGVLYTGACNNPGYALVRTLEQIGYFPKRVIAISQKGALLNEVEPALSGRAECVTIRFSKADEATLAFRPDIATLQLAHFQRILSDEAARLLSD